MPMGGAGAFGRGVPAPRQGAAHLRRTIGAILWRHANGAKWRSLPAELGPWWMAPQTFIRWSRLGVWEWGRFSGEYGALFGELPSETVRRRLR